MNVLDFLQMLDVWTPSPVESTIVLLIGLIIFSLPIIAIIVVILVVKKLKKKKITGKETVENIEDTNNDGKSN